MSEVHRQIILQKLIWWLIEVERERENARLSLSMVNGAMKSEKKKKKRKIIKIHEHIGEICG